MIIRWNLEFERKVRLIVPYIKSNLSLCSLKYVEACKKLAGPISASLPQGNEALFEAMSEQWRGVGNTVTSRSREERATAGQTGRVGTVYGSCTSSLTGLF